MQEGWMRSRWWEFSIGHSTYLIFILTFVNFILISHRLLIERVPFLELFDFELLDEGKKWVQIHQMKKNIELLEAGEKEEMQILLEFNKAGSEIPFIYRVKFQNGLTKSYHKLDRHEEIEVYGPGQALSAPSTQETAKPKKVAQYKEWIPNADFTSPAAESLVDYLSKHRVFYIR